MFFLLLHGATILILHFWNMVFDASYMIDDCISVHNMSRELNVGSFEIDDRSLGIFWHLILFFFVDY